jgi:sulfur relay (sulfurtransferase) complex TusBCD TusD component (DsrE family)
MVKKLDHNRLTIVLVGLIVIATLVVGSSALIPSNQVFAQGTQDSPIVVHIASGDPQGGYDELHRAHMAMSLVNHLQNAGKNVTVFLDVNGVNLGLQQPSFILNGTATMLKTFIENGGSVIVCPHCLTEAGYGAEDLMEGVQLASPEQQTMAKVLSGNTIVIDY